MKLLPVQLQKRVHFHDTETPIQFVLQVNTVHELGHLGKHLGDWDPYSASPTTSDDLLSHQRLSKVCIRTR